MLNLVGTRQRKALRDLWLNKSRSILVIVAIAVGIFGIGTILTSFAILTREMDANYLDTNPPSAVLTIDNLDDAALENIRGFSFVSQAEARRTVIGRIQISDDEWLTIYLFVIDDFDNLQVSTFSPEEGAIKPTTGEIVIERSSRPIIDGDLDIGDVATIRAENGREVELPIVGLNFNPAQPPGWMESVSYGYITLDTLSLFEIPPTLNELHIVFDPTADYDFLADNLSDSELSNVLQLLHAGTSPESHLESHVSDDAPSLDETTIRQIAYSLQTWLTDRGYTVSKIYVPPPGQHPNSDQMQTLLFLLEAFGGLALLLSGLLVATMMSTLLSQQIRQIGVMKAIGARTRQIAGIYLTMVLILAVIGLIIGMPLGIVAGQAMARGVADILNLNINDSSIPHWVFLIQILSGLLVPLLVAAYPIIKGSRRTVTNSITDYGINQRSSGGVFINGILSPLQRLGRIWLLALRSTFRRQGRFVSTLLTLSFGGAAFMVALNVATSWNNTIETSFDYRDYDISVSFVEPYTPPEIESILTTIPAITTWEGWGQANATFVYDGGTNSNEFNVLAPPADTKLVDFQLREGRWLQTDDTNATVINQTLLDRESDLSLGNTITLAVDDRQATFTIVGIVEEVGVPETAYLNYAYFAEWTEAVGTVQHTKIGLNRHDESTQKSTEKGLESAFDNSNIHVASTQLSAVSRQVLLDHVVVLQMVLIMMAVLVVVVGGLGLASTMSMNILERSREIGIMRSIGASDVTILKIILIEGLFVGLLSWLMAIVLSIPLSILMGNVAGQIFIRTNLNLVFAPLGIGVWFVIVTMISAIASALPALRATELPVYEVLAYE